MTADFDPKIRARLVEEMEGLLDDLGRPREADTVGTLLAEAPQAGAADRIAGIPGIASAMLAPLLVELFLRLVRAFLAKIGQEALSGAAKAVVGWISKRFAGRPHSFPSTADRATTIAEITKMLHEAGWPEDLVTKAANDLWTRSQAFANRVAT